MVTKRNDVEPIIPMGLMAELLQCELSWKGSEVEIVHPKRGRLEVKNEGGCPQVSKKLALSLIDEIEEKNRGSEKRDHAFEEEVKWMKSLVKEHPALQGLPTEVKQALVVNPGSWNLIPGNKRKRRAMRSKGFVVHLRAWVHSDESISTTRGR